MQADDLNREPESSPEAAVTDWAPLLSWNDLSSHDAEIARSLLESAGIPVELPNEYAFRIDPPLRLMSGGQWLLVPKNRLAEAQELLASTITNDELDAQALAAVPDEPPSTDND